MLNQIITIISTDPILSKVLAYATTIFIVVCMCEAKPMKRVFKALGEKIKKLITVLDQSGQSPYDYLFVNSRTALIILCVWLYVMAMFMLVYGSMIVFISSIGEILWYKKLVGLLFGLSVMYFARILKVDGDKQLYRLRH